MSSTENKGALVDRLPIVDSMLGMSTRAAVLLLSPILLVLIVVESGWGFYILAEWSDTLTTFHKIMTGLQSAFLVILVVLLIVGDFGLIRRNGKIIKLFAHGALLKGLILGLVGLVHIISVVKNKDEFLRDCRADGSDLCDTINDLNIGLSIGLWIPQELILFVMAVALHSYDVLSMQQQRGPNGHVENGNTAYLQPEYANSYYK